MTSTEPPPRRRRFPRTLLVVVGALIAAALIILRFHVLPRVDRSSNRVLDRGPHTVSDAARKVHDGAFVVDLHADPLLWKRDLRRRHDRGQVDLPRLRQGGVDLQVFGVVTRVPKGTNYRANADTDRLPLLFLGSWRPPWTWWSAHARATAQARELRRLARRSDLSLVLTAADLDGDGLKGLLALEGMHALEGREEALESLFKAGFRMMGLAHFADNEVAGSAHGLEKHGLTELGKKLLPRMEELGITVDLAHASPKTVDDVLRAATRPVVFSHAGVQGTCAGPRNLSDRQLRRLARNGGVVGIGFWKGAVCEPSLAAVVRAVRYAARVAGIDHVAVGTDFDGNITAPVDASGLPRLTEALLASGMGRRDVEKVMGGNARRVLKGNLPKS